MYCWNALGIDSVNNVYAVYGMDWENGTENGCIFQYNAEKDSVALIGNFIDILKENDNYQYGESVPKGHSEIPYLNGKVYLGTQPFHDINFHNWDNYYQHRGSHLLSYNVKTGEFIDCSKHRDGGVFQVYQGIMGLRSMPEYGKIACMSVPEADIMIYNPDNDSLEQIAKGPQDVLKQHVPRNIIACDDKIYFAKGWEDSEIFKYELGDSVIVSTNQYTTGGFWNGKAVMPDGTIYISTVLGNIYKLEPENGQFEFVTNPAMGYEYESSNVPVKFYCLSRNKSGTHLVFIPSSGPNLNSDVNAAHLYTYNINTGVVKDHATLEEGGYTGNSILDSKGRVYFAYHNYSTDGYLVQIDVDQYIQEDETMGVSSFTTSENNITIYPNPVVDEALISVAVKQRVVAHIALYDMAGRKKKFIPENYCLGKMKFCGNLPMTYRPGYM
jgi:hypothetical protein